MKRSDEEKDEVKRLWSELGMSASEIAHQLGNGHTRCTVLGIIHRAGLNRETRQNRTANIVPRTPRKPKAVPDPVIVPATVDPVRDPDGNFFDTLTIKDGHCRFPYGDVGTSDFHYCGNPANQGHSYCLGHEAKAFTKSPWKGNKQEQKSSRAFDFRRRVA